MSTAKNLDHISNISFGQKVIYKSKIHFCFSNHENGLLEIIDPDTSFIGLSKTINSLALMVLFCFILLSLNSPVSSMELRFSRFP